MQRHVLDKSGVKPDANTIEPAPCASVGSSAPQDVERMNREAERRWRDRLIVNPSLSRSLVSFQSNKRRAVYRWFKFKEGFSAELVEYLLDRYGKSRRNLLDPFAGSGTALFAAGAFGMRAEGVELLPICQTIIETKRLIDWEMTPQDLERLVAWLEEQPWKRYAEGKAINELRITRGAYPVETLAAIGKFLAASERENPRVRKILLLALLCVLECVSYTRKDGQYLRWDYRSGRRQGKKVFDKGLIPSFDNAMTGKLQEMVNDLRAADGPGVLFETPRTRTEILLHSGSCLDVLPRLAAEDFDCMITSPPYCNRYDYTRTYALELALLGVDESGLAKLRQDMLSCTVENRAKDLVTRNPNWRSALAAADGHELLQAILAYLESQKALGLLNNDGIPRMVRGYFCEMSCVIAECARVLKPGAPLIMVNDNVRYAGASVSVEIILSEIAERLGFVAEKILVLPNGKGNSSQQMGTHGREALRKCVYVWRKA